ncbi:hypothetical protein ES703_04912 [subsurface metagenome]
MRWSDASVKGEFAMLAIYAKKDQERIDQDIFKIHPFLSFWGEGDCADGRHCPDSRCIALKEAEAILAQKEANHGD